MSDQGLVWPSAAPTLLFTLSNDGQSENYSSAMAFISICRVLSFIRSITSNSPGFSQVRISFVQLSLMDLRWLILSVISGFFIAIAMEGTQ